MVMDDKNNKLYIFFIIVGGPIDLRKSKVVILDMDNMEVIGYIKKLEPSVTLLLSQDCSKIIYKEEKGTLLKIHDIEKDANISDIISQTSKPECFLL